MCFKIREIRKIRGAYLPLHAKSLLGKANDRLGDPSN
jgi:hypothetical protein